MENFYSLDNARKFNWSSISGNINLERLSHLEKYLIGNRILDAGCGGGAYVELLSQRNFQVTGVENNDDFLQFIMRERSLGKYVKADITKLPFPDKSFDSVYCFDVLEHVNDHLAISELTRVASKRLIITVPQEDQWMHKFNLTFLHYQDKTHLRNYTRESIQGILNSHQYNNIKIFEELPIPIENLMQEFNRELLDNYKYQGLIDLLLKKIFTGLQNRLLNKSKMQPIYTSLVAIIDIQ
jgi:SAM-dependent methyltransferase